MALLPTSLLALRSHSNIAKIPPYLSFACIVVGILWLIILPVDGYFRQTYISENALLPGQARTYFGGSEHNIFRAYRHEVASLKSENHTVIAPRLEALFASNHLKAARQKYVYDVNGRNITGENVYAIIEGPRADATEAIVLVAPWINMDGLLNQSGVALVLALARYFKQWSFWSKDILFLLCSDSIAGPHAWVDAYHNAHTPESVDALVLKSGALQGAVAVDYPAGPRGHRFEKVHIVYEGLNGQLPNLDLVNTAISIAGTQLGMGVTLQQMWKHGDTYKDRLSTIIRGMLNQGVSHTSGPHSAFIPYHVDAITLQAVGDGWHDEITLGKMVESLFRSLNNLLEHFHQSFFFYFLMHTHHFVSIGTYLPSAMLIAANFTISSIALWLQSSIVYIDNQAGYGRKPGTETEVGREMMIIKEKDAVATIPSNLVAYNERGMVVPILFVTLSHIFGLLPLYATNNTSERLLATNFFTITVTNFFFAQFVAYWLSQSLKSDNQTYELIQCFSLLLLGVSLSALATLNFSLSYIVGLASIPLSFMRRRNEAMKISIRDSVILGLLSPNMVMYAVSFCCKLPVTNVLMDGLTEWHISGIWTQIVIWLIWWPAWFSITVIIASPIYVRRKT